MEEAKKCIKTEDKINMGGNLKRTGIRETIVLMRGSFHLNKMQLTPVDFFYIDLCCRGVLVVLGLTKY